jgi:hypothetical protein
MSNNDPNDRYSNLKRIYPKYYQAGIENIAIAETNHSNSENNFVKLKFRPFYEFETDSIKFINSQGKTNHIDVYNMIKSIVDLKDGIMYECIGTIVILGKIVLISGIEFDKGSVKMLINPYYDLTKLSLTQDDSGTIPRKPYIIFETNSKKFRKGSGYIGDVGINGIGSANINRSFYENLSSDYSLSAIDLIVDVRGNYTKVDSGSLPSEGLRYSGEYNKFRNDFGKFDYDTFPYPEDDDRDIDNSVGSMDVTPGSELGDGVLYIRDDNTCLTWSDDGLHIAFNDKET